MIEPDCSPPNAWTAGLRDGGSDPFAEPVIAERKFRSRAPLGAADGGGM
jgi:hypothetical protein